MIAELGHFALILALCMAILQGTMPLVGAHRGWYAWMNIAPRAARAQFLFVALAFAALVYAFVVKDFSVAYVARNSNSALPLGYRVAAVWGAHEGSLLLWSLILGIWTVAVSYFSRSLPTVFSARVLAVMGLISIGFLLFMLTTSSPFERLLPAAVDGNDLNPLLQDIGLIIHPPMLYMGYVGLAVPFSFAVAALLDGRLDLTWSRWTRPWTTVAWVFLTVGITLGSWWAYYELGWGGWWFWDPVENASFMPWLVATALLHSLAVTEKRGAFKAWTVILSIFAFSLSLLGTFLVRSGVIVSVHAFATDPARGVFILIFLCIVVGSALLLYSWRAARVTSDGTFALVSKETMMLVNNVLLMVAAGAVLYGTLSPVIHEALDMPKISVGPPYFNSVFIKLTLPLVFLIGIGPLARWKRDDPADLGRRLRLALLITAALGAVFVILISAPRSVMVVLGLTLAAWVTVTMAQAMLGRLATGSSKIRSIMRLPRGFVGMTIAHFGVAVFVVGVTIASTYSLETDVRMSAGETADLGGYDFEFLGVSEVPGPNYQADIGQFKVTRNGREIAMLKPEKRVYLRQEQPMTEAGIDAGFFRDLYVALGEPLPDGAWSVRLYYKPMVRWIWLGPLLMGLGGLVSVSDRRYRNERVSDRAGSASPALPSEA